MNEKLLLAITLSGLILFSGCTSYSTPDEFCAQFTENECSGQVYKTVEINRPALPSPLNTPDSAGQDNDKLVAKCYWSEEENACVSIVDYA